MLSKFFRKRPSEGKPLALVGLAAGLAAMDNAWATLDCLGGSVQWNHGRPTIVPPGSGGSGSDLPAATTEYKVLAVVDISETATPDLQWREDWVRWP
jgi:hypothetical protein